MTTVNLVGKASKIIVVDRVRGVVKFTFKTTGMTEAIKMYNELVTDIKNNVQTEDELDPLYNISIGSLSIISSTEAIRRTFKRCVDTNIFTQAIINFDTSRERKFTGDLIGICEKFISKCKESKSNWKMDNEVVYSISQSVYLSDKLSEIVRTELLNEAVKDGYTRLSYILDGINAYSAVNSHNVPMATKYKEIRLVNIGVPNLSNTYYKASSNRISPANASLDGAAMFMEDMACEYETDELGDNKTTINISIDMIFEIEY